MFLTLKKKKMKTVTLNHNFALSFVHVFCITKQAQGWQLSCRWPKIDKSGSVT